MAKYCPSCGAMLREGSRFCQQCGTSFSEPCPQCGAPVSGTKFCPECGYKLEPLLPVEKTAGGIYEEVSSDNSASTPEEPVYRTPRQTENTSYTTKQTSSPFEVGSTHVNSAFENRPSKKPFYKKWWFWLIAGLVVLGIIGSAAGNSDKVDISSDYKKETASDSVSSKKERNGFDKETNNDYEVGGIRYSVPDYFDDDNTPDDSLQLFAEDEDNRVMLQFNTFDNVSFSSDEIYSKLDEAYDSYLDGMEVHDVKQAHSEKTTLAGLPAKHYSGRGKSSHLEDADLIMDVTFGYDDETHMVHSVMLLQSGDPKYSYNSDYEKIVESADKTDKSNGEHDNSSENVSAGVKEAMDSYEAFVDEYVAFMQKYENSSDTTSMLSEYMNYISRYAELTEKMEALEDEEMSDADFDYYTEVMLRCSQKMLQAAG